MSQQLFIAPHATHPTGRSQRGGPITAGPRQRVLALISTLLGCALPALAAPSQSRPRSVLANVPGLEQHVTYTETKIPLGELVAKVAADTGVPLTAARDVADEPVAVVVTDFPARELLEQLADLLDYHWSRRGVGQAASLPNGKARQANSLPHYQIWQDLGSKKREEALRQAMFGGMEKNFQKEMAVVRELAGKSQEEIQRLWEERKRWYERLDKLTPTQQQALEDSQEGRRYNRLPSMWSPIQRSLAGWVLRLPPAQWAALRAGRAFIYSSDPKPGELPLPPDVLRVFRTSRPMLPPSGQQRREEEARQGLWGLAEQYRVTVRLGDDPPRPVFTLLHVAARPFGADGRSLYPAPQSRYEGFQVSVYGGEVFGTEVEDAGRRALLEQDPLLSVKKPYRSDRREYADLQFPGSLPRARFVTEFLPEVARAYGVDCIADAYSYAVRPFGFEGSTPKPLDSFAGSPPLYAVLDHLATRYQDWDRRGSLVRFRSRHWFLARPAEIPLRLVRHWLVITDRLGALPLAEVASFASTLTDYQMPLLWSRWAYPPQLDDLQIGDRGDVAHSRSLMRLYMRLPPAQQQALWDGKPLALADLSPALRPLVLEALHRIARTVHTGIGLEEWERGQITFTRKPDVRLRERRGKAVTFRLESDPAPRATTPPDEVTRFPVTHLEMRMHYGPQKSYALRLIVAADPAAPD